MQCLSKQHVLRCAVRASILKEVKALLADGDASDSHGLA